MDNITEKIARVTDLSTYTEITPEYLKKVFDDIGGSPEKLRTILNLWFNPDFKPSFIEPQNDAFTGFHDIGIINAPEVDKAPRPLRLIELETGNMVDEWTTNPSDVYCMLSHRWKGSEITLAHIQRARSMHLERTKNGTSNVLDSDIGIVLEQAKLDILEQETTILSLTSDNADGKTVNDLLAIKVDVGDAKEKLNGARKDHDKKKSAVEQRRMEKTMFDHLAQSIHHKIGDGEHEVTDSSLTSSSVVDEAEAEYAVAKDAFDAASKSNNEARDKAKFLSDNRPLSDALDEMIRRLERWKSAVKLENSMNEARQIFKTKLYPQRGSTYIWSDTCCIDKSNYGELSQSLSLMGDWYANAEFCIVHLDTDVRVDDAIRNWKLFKDEAEEQQPNIASFKAIQDGIPEWAKRAWTLQELVMSKMVFFTNSEWESLSRPVESLGYIYPLVPFIDIYTAGDIGDTFSEGLSSETLRAIVDSDALKVDDSDVIIADDSEDESASGSIKDALRLVSILHALGFVFPTDMTIETAVPEMSRSVYLAAWNLVRDLQNGDDHDGDGYSESTARPSEVLCELKNQISSELESGIPTEDPEDEAQYVINFLLFCLAQATKDLVVSDRKSIAKFGQVQQLESWKQGIARSGFSAQRVLQLSSKRVATVAVDHVYSLMGILGVRFQSFHAEGYAKALARLLDEVVVNHNDVSVFNWTGVGMGSPVRGRSMYASFHEAYSNEQDHGRRYNMMISADVQKQRKTVMVAYHGVITLLRDTIDCIKSKGREGLPLEWVQEISTFIRTSEFERLRPLLDNIGRILRYIKLYSSRCVPAQTVPETQEPVDDSPPPTPSEGFGFGRSFTKSSLSSLQPSIKASKLSSFGFGGISKPSFSRHHSEPAKKDVSSGDAKQRAPSQVPEWRTLDAQVKKYLRSLPSSDPELKAQSQLPSQILDLDLETLEHEIATESRCAKPTALHVTDDMTCPNPIIIDSSGIEGIFDIQRIVVTFIDREKLSRQVARATSPKQKISGWCMVSTGFASVAVNFACDQHILKKQLDIEQAVQDRIIKEDRSSKLHSTLEIVGASRTKEKDGASPKDDEPSDTLNETDNKPDNDETDKNETDKNKAMSWKPTEEEKTIVRIIDFIQEPQLQLVAGEWVLARFSGAPGAKWFLCHLELGSTHSFYGHRIAASDIDFANSAIEPGLMNAWKTYMKRKKGKMCKVLDKYLSSSASAIKSQEKSKIANENYARLWDVGNHGVDRVMSMGSISTSSSPSKHASHENGTKVDGDVDSDDDEKSVAGIFEDLLDQGKEAATALGEYTVYAAWEIFCEMEARHLDKHLSTSVLKRTPQSLQTAVESVDENKGFLPAMYHSSRRVHMF